MGRKYRNLFDQIVDINNLRNAYAKTVRGGKRYSNGHLVFKENLEYNLYQLQQQMIEGNYRHGDYYQFKIYDPKERTITCLPFSDRVVQHAIHNVIEPIFDNGFYSCNYACRKNKGTHKAVKDVQASIRSASKSGSVYYLKTDFSKYFPSIDMTVLFREIMKKIKCAKTMLLIKAFIDSSDKGIKIGSLLSQLFANIYGNILDRFVKTKLKFKHYFRYMDDAVFIGNDKKELYRIKNIIERFSGIYMKLRFSKWFINSIAQPLNFVGYRISESYKLIRKDSVSRAKRRIKRYKASGSTEKLEKFMSAWQGHVKSANSKNLMTQLTR